MTYEQLEKCYNTILKQRDEAEVKVVELTEFIDNDLFDNFNYSDQQMIIKRMEKIGV